MPANIDISNIATFSDQLKDELLQSLDQKKEIIDTLNFIKESDFSTSRGKNVIEKFIKELSSDVDAKDLIDDSTFVEIISFHCLRKVFDINIYNFEYKLGSTTFPDIIIIDSSGNRYGFEVKRVGANDVLGNSSTQVVEDIKEIYAISFFNNGDDIHIAKYENLIYDIDVDHNPRFRLRIPDPTQNNFSNIFSEGNLIDYFALSQEERERIVAKYLRKKYENNDERWFLGQSTNIIAEFLEELSNKSLNKNEFRVYIFCYFPQIFSMRNYHDIRKIALKKFKYLGAVKDIFTASGVKYGFPRIYVNLIETLSEINEKLVSENINKDEWKQKVKESIKVSGDLTAEKENELWKIVDKKIK